MAISSAISIFLGAFLLFLVQPILGKMILPWFGGTPAVWTTCMLFFQVLLLGGYAYAAALTRLLKPGGQAVVHAALLIAALCLLPITPGVQWKPVDGTQPAVRILVMLLACVGLQYFLLSATSPLVQTWFAHANPGKSPYRLYALSNVGSLGALLLYPFLIEPAIGTVQQGWLWSAAFGLFVVLSVAMAVQLRWLHRTENERTPNTSGRPAGSASSAPSSSANTPADLSSSAVAGASANASSSSTAAAVTQAAASVKWLDRAIWLGLPALASMMLLAVTNHVCQDVAVVPFLWIAPLALYLVSLIICFDRDQWYKPMLFALGAIFVILFACDMAFMAYVYQNSTDQPRWVYVMKYDIRLLLTVYLSLFFFGCMLCHGEVVRRRPAPQRLTEFYLTISAGGALGGFLVAIVCPLIFTTFAELKIGIVLTFGLAVVVLLRQMGIFKPASPVPAKAVAKQPKKRGKETSRDQGNGARPNMSLTRTTRYLLGVVGVVLFGVVIAAQSLVYDSSHTAGPKIQQRNFYGSLTVRDWYPEDDPLHGRALYHGTILHGYQFLTPTEQLKPTTYYTEDSGVGLVLRAQRQDQPVKVGAVGLGIGTVSAYSQGGDVYRFYEINPLIINLAKSNFSFLSQCQGTTEVVAGDARLSLEREEPQGFDALILDAFSGDSIPVHLLTREAMEEYWRHLKPNGVLIVHISNRYVDLKPVVDRLAVEFDLQTIHVQAPDAVGLHISSSEWMALSKDGQLFDHPALVAHRSDPRVSSSFRLWTDDYNNLVQILRSP